MRWGLWLLCSDSFLARPAVRGHSSAFVSSCNLRVAALLGVHRAVVANLWMSSGWDQATRRGMSVRFSFGGVTCICIRSRRRKIFGWLLCARWLAGSDSTAAACSLQLLQRPIAGRGRCSLGAGRSGAHCPRLGARAEARAGLVVPLFVWAPAVLLMGVTGAAVQGERMLSCRQQLL